MSSGRLASGRGQFITIELPQHRAFPARIAVQGFHHRFKFLRTQERHCDLQSLFRQGEVCLSATGILNTFNRGFAILGCLLFWDLQSPNRHHRQQQPGHFTS